MDFVVYLALGVLIVVFVVSLIILIIMCRRRVVQLKYLTFSPSTKRFSELNEESLEGIAQLSPAIAAALDKNSWVYDVSGLLQHCVALLRLCHSLSDRLSNVPVGAHIKSHPPLNAVLCEATHKVMPAFDDLLNSVASPNVDVRVLESRATTLATICWSLMMPFVVINPRVHEQIGFPMHEMQTHLQLLRNAADLAEKAEMGKMQMDWDTLAEEDEDEALKQQQQEEEEDGQTKIETTPLVDTAGPSTSTADSKEEKR